MPPTLPLPGPGEQLAQLPAVDRLLNAPPLAALAQELGQSLVKRAAQAELAAARDAIKNGAAAPPFDALVAASAAATRKLAAPRLTPVVNLTGTVIHTNLGRALLAAEAIDAVADAMRQYVALEYDLAGAGRGDRDDIVEVLLHELTGASAATVVNNNAGAVLLALAALAARREVIVSRGELIEIGGAFRLPDIMKAAGCKLVEVGTTNRTHPRDYEDAITPKTALIVKAHWSNYAITGFTAAVDDKTLAAIAHRAGLPYMVDLGAGALIDLSHYGLPRELLPQESLAAGADVVTFSGDKLLGGPQAGLIVGTADAIAKIKKHPLKRALRCSKLTLAALEATLRIYASGHRLPERLPVLALLTRPAADIRAACERVQAALAAFAGKEFTASIEACASQIGSGSLPVERLPSFAVVLAPAQAKGAGRAVERLAAQLRALPTPVVGRIADQRLWLDGRCLRVSDEAALLAQLRLAASFGRRSGRADGSDSAG
ncbi:MAG: L-seryl-tRNA(Sec) selenium transferase [Betaproteobacteria bacterium]